MGWYGTTLGRYSLLIHDSIYDYVKQNKPLSYYEKYKINAEFSMQIDDGDELREEIQIPLLKLGTLELIKVNYKFEFDINTRKLLFDELKNKNYLIEGYCYITTTTSNKENKFKNYYLTTPLLCDDIILSTKLPQKRTVINSMEELDWLALQGINFSYLRDINEVAEKIEENRIPKEQWSVHEKHCCEKHCKYGDKNCPVVLGLTSGISIEEFEKGF